MKDSLRNKIGFWYWNMLQKRYCPIHDWMYNKADTNKIYYYIFSIIDIIMFIISYSIIRLCGLRMD